MIAVRKGSNARRAEARAFLLGISLDGSTNRLDATRPAPRIKAATDLRLPIATRSLSLTESVDPRRARRAKSHSFDANVAVDPEVTSSLHAEFKFVRSLDDAKNRLRGNRVVLTQGGHPVSIFSSLRYVDDEKNPPVSIAGNTSVIIEGINVSTSRSGKSVISYDYLLTRTWGAMATMTSDHHPGGGELSPISCNYTFVYDGLMLDDPEMVSGKHKKVMTVCGYRFSVLEYAKPAQIKRNLNQQFRDRFPHVHLTLSKLRSIKRSLAKVGEKFQLDLGVIALGYVYYELFVHKGKVNKTNRKIAAGCCLLLAAKMCDVRKAHVRPLMDCLVDVLHVSHRDLLIYEFPVLVALEFCLHVPPDKVRAHCEHLGEYSLYL